MILKKNADEQRVIKNSQPFHNYFRLYQYYIRITETHRSGFPIDSYLATNFTIRLKEAKAKGIWEPDLLMVICLVLSHESEHDFTNLKESKTFKQASVKITMEKASAYVARHPVAGKSKAINILAWLIRILNPVKVFRDEIHYNYFLESIRREWYKPKIELAA